MNYAKMKIAAACCALFCGHISSAQAVTTPITFVGGGFFTAQSSSCASAGFEPNQGFTVIFRPAAGGLPDGLVLQYVLGSTAFAPTSGNSLNGRQPFVSTGISDKAITYSSNGTSNLKIVTAPNGLSVTITGTLNNVYGDPTCTLTVRAATTQRP